MCNFMHNIFQVLNFDKHVLLRTRHKLDDDLRKL